MKQGCQSLPDRWVCYEQRRKGKIPITLVTIQINTEINTEWNQVGHCFRFRFLIAIILFWYLKNQNLSTVIFKSAGLLLIGLNIGMGNDMLGYLNMLWKYVNLFHAHKNSPVFLMYLFTCLNVSFLPPEMNRLLLIHEKKKISDCFFHQPFN